MSLAAVLLALSACGEGGGAIITPGDDDDDPPACTDETCGQVEISLSDAEGDFLSYAVDVVSIRLEKENGDTVQALPTRQRVDFADLVTVAEFVTAATVPNGEYVAARVRLDYTDAEASVEVLGVPTPASIVDENGAPLGIVDIDVALDAANHFTVAPGTPAFLQFDFDLAATHIVNPLATPVTATADPVLVATIVPLVEREFRLRGPLVSVNEGAGSYAADVRPFNHPDAKNGQMTVLTTTDTVFEVDGEELDRVEALAALADAGAGLATVAQGTYDTDDASFTADSVLAGSSVPGAEFDGVTGNVTARSGNDLIVRGGTVVRADDDDDFYVRGDIRVRVDAGTIVTKDGGGAVDTDAISVGQRITALGVATSSSDVNPTLDARDGRVRLHQTHLSGFVVGTITGQLTLDLFAVDGRNPGFFDFTGTGGADADPTNYQVDTGDLDLADFDTDDPARVFGFVAPFGTSPPDFEGQTLVQLDDIRALLGIGWGAGGTSAPFLSMGRDGFVVDTGNGDLGVRRFLQLGPRINDITTLASPITIEPATEGRTLYAISRDRDVEVFTDFEEFATKVNSRLNGGSDMRALTARGTFDSDTTTLTASYVSIILTLP